MKDYTEMMLANAHNNWCAAHGGQMMTVLRSAYEDPRYAEFYKHQREVRGYVFTLLEDVPHETLRMAMDWYKKHTDWSAFKRTDWEKAYASLN